MGSLGICLMYPACTRSSSDCGAFCLSSVYCEMRERSWNKSCLSTDSLARRIDWLYDRNRDRDQDQDHADDDHQLDQGKAALPPVAELVPLPGPCTPCRRAPVPCALVNTSKTFCPPQESESGSSCMERRPHSVLLVIGIDRNAAQEADFLAAHVHTFHQSVEVRRIALGTHFDLECLAVGGVFVAVDGVAQLPEVMAQLALFRPHDGHPRHRYSQSGEDHQDGGGHDQFNEREPACGRVLSRVSGRRTSLDYYRRKWPGL